MAEELLQEIAAENTNNNNNSVKKIGESESTADGVNNNNNNEDDDGDGRVLRKTANSKVFLTKIFPRRPLSLPANRVGDVNHNLTVFLNEEVRRRDKRKTFHQDVEEAINSLLWQPYEYQNKRTFSDNNSSSLSLSYTSCSSSLSSLDLEDYNAVSSAAEQQRHGNAATDLHQEEMTMMVNNLSLDQSEEAVASRERRRTTRLSSERTNAVSECCAAATVKCVVGEEEEVGGACDDFECDMRLEVPPCSNSGQDGGGGYQQRSISAGNLSSANVVGLPSSRYNTNHQRYGSHVETTPQNVVQHMRSASVPKNMQPQKVCGESNGNLQQQQQRALNVSNVNVNFYRAVPVNVVSSVPTIQCVNSDNVSNVHIMPLSGATQVSVHDTQATTPSCNNVQVQTNPQQVVVKRPEARTRTFTSTEAQTDEISVCSPPPPPTTSDRERRRERRRQQRRLTTTNTTTTTHQSNDRLPDILNSHLPPPYSPPPPQVLPPPPPPPPPLQPPQMVPGIVTGAAIMPYPPPMVAGGQMPLVQTTAAPIPVPVTAAAASGFRFPFPATGFRR